MRYEQLRIPLSSHSRGGGRAQRANLERPLDSLSLKLGEVVPSTELLQSRKNPVSESAPSLQMI